MTARVVAWTPRAIEIALEWLEWLHEKRRAEREQQPRNPPADPGKREPSRRRSARVAGRTKP